MYQWSSTEPRGNDVLVGALLETPHSDQCDHGVIFFNNIGPLNMCGHGTIGLLVTLRHLNLRSEPLRQPAQIVRLEAPSCQLTYQKPPLRWRTNSAAMNSTAAARLEISS